MLALRWTQASVAVLVLASLTAGQEQQNNRARPSSSLSANAPQWEAAGKQGAVVAGGQEAVEAGLEVLRSGGNAADATATTLLAQSVTDANQFCFGGEVPIMVYDAERKVVEILVGQGAAPRLATADHFRKAGGIPASGIETATVPATLDACLTLLERHGTRTFAQSVAPALAILDRGEFGWHTDLAKTLRRLIEAEQQAKGDRRRGLRLVADYFYRGPIAWEIDAWARSAGSFLRYSDLATHVTRIDEPVTGTYRGHTVYKGGPWTQGPCLLQALALLDSYDLKSLGHNKADTIHYAVESLKLALADRDLYLGDPLFSNIPVRELLSPSYTEVRRALIDSRRASLVLRPGDPRGGKALVDPMAIAAGPGGAVNDTSTCVVADGQGNVIAATPSGWSGVVAGKTGVWLGSRLQSFNLIEGSPNCLEPGKRPRITLTPTLVFKDNQPRLAISVAGGDGQDQVTLQLLMNAIDFGLDPAAAVTAPRFETKHFISSFRQVPPELGVIRIHEDVGPAVLDELKARGHKLNVVRSAIWVPTMIAIDAPSGLLRAAGDPKVGRHAGAY